MKLRRMAGLVHLAGAAVLMLAVWLGIVYVASRPALRTLIDLTPQSVNTVSPATEDLLRELRAQKIEVEFHLFFPRVTGQPSNPAQQQELVIRDRLQQATQLLVRRYQWLGGESIKIKIHDLVNDLESTREAAQTFEYKGPYDEVVVTVRLPGRERRFRKLSLLADLAEIRLPDMQPQQGPGAQMKVPVLKQYLGEVGLSSAIKGLLVQGTPVVYFLNLYSRIDFTNESIGSAYGNLVTALRNLGFETRVLDTSRQHVVPPDAALVVVLEPVLEFSDLDAQALFEYVRRGGRLFLNYAWSPVDGRNPTGASLSPNGKGIGQMLGFEVGLPPVFHLIQDPSGRTGGRGLDGDPAVAKLQLALSAQHPVTRGLAQGRFALEVGGARELRELGSPPAGVRIEPLLETGSQAWLASPEPNGQMSLKAPPPTPNLLRPFLVGLAIEVDPIRDDPAGGQGGTPPAEDRKGEVIVVSGVFCNNMGLPAFGDLAFNICNWMAERKVLMNIQSSKYQSQQMQVQPQQVERVRTLLVYVVPGFLLAAGLVVFFVRRRV